ncbi:MAG TPA: hypothetical protein VMN60_05060 [Longimicrobiales bacterium]|nr:hypothetical protein [Longimicrobiales bacterium]
MKSKKLLIGWCALAALAPPVRVVGQQQCSSCRFVLVEQVKLSSAAAEVTPSTDASVARLPNGTYVVSHRFATPALLLYDARGRLLRSHVQRGMGPGELSSPPRVFVGPDGLLAAFSGNRLIRFDTTLQHVSTIKVDVAPRTYAVFMRNGLIAVDAPIRTDDGNTFTFHLLSAAGTLEKSLEPTRQPTGPMLIAGSADGLWVARRNDSYLRLYSERGELIRSLRIDRDWFRPWSAPLQGEGLTLKPRPRKVQLVQRDSRTIVVLTLVADENWSPPVESVQQPLAGLNTLQPADLWDTVIEAVDTSTGEVQASGRSQHMLQSVEGTAHEFYSTAIGEAGHVTITIWRLELRPR